VRTPSWRISGSRVTIQIGAAETDAATGSASVIFIFKVLQQGPQTLKRKIQTMLFVHQIVKLRWRQLRMFTLEQVHFLNNVGRHSLVPDLPASTIDIKGQSMSLNAEADLAHAARRFSQNIGSVYPTPLIGDCPQNHIPFRHCRTCRPFIGLSAMITMVELLPSKYSDQFR
jgi:hypothetical protein